MGRRKIVGTLVGIGKRLGGVIDGVFGVFQKGRFVQLKMETTSVRGVSSAVTPHCM